MRTVTNLFRASGSADKIDPVKIDATGRYMCPVCGFAGLAEEPHSAENGDSYEICPSCGFEFGHSDASEGFTYEQWRASWVTSGANWFSTSRSDERAADWNPEAQLRSLD